MANVLILDDTGMVLGMTEPVDAQTYGREEVDKMLDSWKEFRKEIISVLAEAVAYTISFGLLMRELTYYGC